MSNIEWTGKTWNPIVGCSKVSPGCQNCYAIKQAYRNASMGAKLANPGRLAYYEGLTEKRGNRVEWTGKVAFVPEALEIPLKTQKPTTWFVNSMSDLFHESVTDEQIARIWDVMAATPQHTYQILTKRPRRMLDFVSQCSRHVESWAYTHNGDNPEPRGSGIIVGNQWPLPNVWLGVTVENQQTGAERVSILRDTPAAVKFLSCEPLLENIFLANLRGIDWVIVGGESGPGARPCNIAWIRSIVDQCKAAGVACFVKQLGSKCYGLNHGYTGKGTNPDEWPADIRVRQMPEVSQCQP